MIVYRLAIEQYKDDISGVGAKRYGGRWNKVGIPVLYTSQHISLAVLEILVRTSMETIPLNYFLIKIEIPDSAMQTVINVNKLKKDWRNDTAYTQYIGNEVIIANKVLVLQLPSAIIEEEYNYLINTEHIAFKKIKIIETKKFTFDKRLYLKNE